MDPMTQDPFDRELTCPSIDVCAWCGDSECDGVGCIASLDSDIDIEAVEQLQTWLRLGRIQEQANEFLAIVENRR